MMVNNNNALIPELVIPNGFKRDPETIEVRNKEDVRVVRYNNPNDHRLNNEHVVLVFGSDNRLISYNGYYEQSGDLPDDEESLKIAEGIFEKLDPKYARGLSFIRIDYQSRSFHSPDGKEITIPIKWVKFAHRNGSYNWVSVGPNGSIVEMERESQWDYFRGRRKTEQWNLDDWVLAREGNGSQLDAPNALA